jgi:hypothetical protein
VKVELERNPITGLIQAVYLDGEQREDVVSLTRKADATHSEVVITFVCESYEERDATANA